ncbi:hypothetical protein EH203_14975 [Pectobacterium carotovorum subsp. carotovorum]|uniref:hypothetical protein n=1 Tax=Pectobacterium carotovorum TaxID=554 RepID=UPI0013746B69|nr:hypothetical protein [Pectobacterium carotovorum]QHP55028.1 hypothetical protein EH203_14975 [Pectobacterium carotovorum subsp. carotovorum]
MDSEKLIQNIINDVENVKSGGSEAIQIDSLLNYLEKIDTTNIKKNQEFILEGFKHQNSTELEFLKIRNAFQIESFKSVISIGANACRTFLIMNGGAAIALLAFLGNIWNKDSSANAAQAIAMSLVQFCVGVIFAGLCAGFTYFSQSCFTSSELGEQKKFLFTGYIFNTLACLFGIGSLIVFGLGTHSAYTSMIAQLVK